MQAARAMTNSSLFRLGLVLLLPISTRLECTLDKSGREPSKTKYLSRASQFVGREIPDFHLRDIHGSLHSKADLQGTTSLFIFFRSSDCRSCLSEAIYWEWLHVRNASVKVLGVVDEQNLAGLRRFISVYRLSFPILADRNRVLFQEFDVEHTPVKFLFDQRGTLASVSDSVFKRGQELLEFVRGKGSHPF